MYILAMCLGGFLLFSFNAVFGLFAKELMLYEMGCEYHHKITKHKKLLFLILVPPLGVIAMFIAVAFSMTFLIIDDFSD